MKLSDKDQKTIDKRKARGCGYCGGMENLTIDHMHPKILGGTDDIKNLRILCRRCNKIKSAIPHGTLLRMFALWEEIRETSKLKKAVKRIKL